MNSNVSEADVVLNRLNVALVRSQRIIDSWLPKKSAEEVERLVQEQDDDEDFKPMTENGGIGSKAAYDDDASPARTLQRKKAISNDKLLEQLLGRKAAQSHKKAQETRKSMSVTKHAAPKSLPNRPKILREVHSDEDEKGRSAAFRSRKSGKGQTNDISDPIDEVRKDASPFQDASRRGPDAMEDDEAILSNMVAPSRAKPSKQNYSYLDELLTQKAKKKKKKKARQSVDS